MHLHSQFSRFRELSQPSSRQRSVMTEEHRLLRERLSSDTSLRGIVSTTLIQGSHRRGTAIRGEASHPCDVDIIVLTTLSPKTITAKGAHELFQPFLERNYPRRFSQRMRSWCITIDAEVRLDLVPMAQPENPAVTDALRAPFVRDWAPGEDVSPAVPATAIDWNRAEPLLIPDRRLEQWERTHPIVVLDWTAQKSARCNGHFTQTVRALKWWWRRVQPQPQYLKGYPLEHLVGECCPNGATSVATGVAATLETITNRFRGDAAALKVPTLPARGVPEVNVLRRVEPREFAQFHREADSAAAVARKALNSPSEPESARLWESLFGDAIR